MSEVVQYLDMIEPLPEHVCVYDHVGWYGKYRPAFRCKCGEFRPRVGYVPLDRT